jgi:cytochrome c553
MFLVLIGAGAVLFAWSGVYNVAASEGHWAVTRWFLEFAMRRSVATHALGVEEPPPLSEAMFRRGLGHFAGACAPCHGAPGEPRNVVVQQMLPEPPDLPGLVPNWSDQQLFWIVKYGLKYTGMPAWPAQQRDDEVWAMAAFLRRLPDLTPQEYARLTEGDIVAKPQSPEPMSPLGPLTDLARSALVTCARCHGLMGEGDAIGAFPRLAGQSELYLLDSLRSYATGLRPSGMMQTIAAELSAETMEELAAYFASINPATVPPESGADGGSAASATRLELGARIALHGIPNRGVPACATCHGPAQHPRESRYPSLAGQSADYLVGQLRLWQRRIRGGSLAAQIMEPLADGLTEGQLLAVAAFYASLPPERGNAAASSSAPTRRRSIPPAASIRISE